MLRNVSWKSVRDQRRALTGWAVVLVLLAGMYAAFYPSIHRSGAYSDIINQMPDSLRALFTAGGAGDFTSGAGYLYVELLSFMAPLLVLLYAIGTGAGTIAGEEERHTLDLLLANPVSRRRVALEKYAALLVGVVALTTTLAVAVTVLGNAAGMGLSVGNVAATAVHLALLGAVFGALALLVGAATGRLAAGRAVPALVAVAAYLVNGFAPTVGWLRPVRKFSPFYQYLGHDPIRHGLSLAAVGVTVATTIVLLAVAVWTFERRDLA